MPNNEHDNNTLGPPEKYTYLQAVMLVVILVAVAASVWLVARAFRAPLPYPAETTFAVEPALLPAASAPSVMPGMAADAPVPHPVPPVRGEFVTDFATMAQREQVARETADALRRQARENPATAASEEFIKSVERGDAAIQ